MTHHAENTHRVAKASSGTERPVIETTGQSKPGWRTHNAAGAACAFGETAGGDQ